MPLKWLANTDRELLSPFSIDNMHANIVQGQVGLACVLAYEVAV
jgi:hypothetical protein